MFRRTSPGFVIQVGAQPLLGLRGRPALAPGVVLDLVPAQVADAEVLGSGMVYVPAAPAAGGRHRAALRQADAGRGLRPKQLEKDGLFRVVRTGGIPGRGPDAAVPLTDEVGVAKVLNAAESTSLAGPLVKHLRHSLGEPVAESLAHDRMVVAASRPERGRNPVAAVACRHGKPADVVDPPAFPGRNKVGEAVVELAGGFFLLLAQHVEPDRKSVV